MGTRPQRNARLRSTPRAFRFAPGARRFEAHSMLKLAQRGNCDENAGKIGADAMGKSADEMKVTRLL
jgi:hypothetical protein